MKGDMSTPKMAHNDSVESIRLNKSRQGSIFGIAPKMRANSTPPSQKRMSVFAGKLGRYEEMCL